MTVLWQYNYDIYMNKEFIKTETIQKNAFLLAEKIYNDKFIPSILYVSLRGGALLGNVISEYFKLSTSVSHPPLYAAVVAQSYTGPQEQEKVLIEGWTYDPQKIRRNDKIILIDDIFDSGRTVNALCDIFIDNGALRENIRIVVHDYKIRDYELAPQKYAPDYYARKLHIKKVEQDNWIHYLSHEVDGLTENEINTHYSATLQPVLKTLIERRKKIMESSC